MRKLVEFQILDSNAVYYGTNLFDLMTNAGNIIADYIRNNYSKSEKIVFVCGLSYGFLTVSYGYAS